VQSLGPLVEILIPVKENPEMMNILNMSSLFQPSKRGKRKKSMKKTATFEKQADGWWAIQNLGEDNILGHGATKEAALMDLEHHVANFANFLKSTGRNVPESLMTPNGPSRPISRA
jgi:hypothetical protein